MTVLALVVAALTVQWAPDLPRRSFLGVSVREAAGHLVVVTVFPDGTAEGLGLAGGDTLVALDGVALHTTDAFVRHVAGKATGDSIAVHVRRGGSDIRAGGVMREFPRERIEGAAVLYDAVQLANGDVLRTIVTRPEGDGSRPAMLFLQGLGCASLDRPIGTAWDAETMLAHEVTRAGFVTMRVEKSGLGDSRGTPCSELDLEAELAGYREGLHALRAYPFVDTTRVFLVGYSMGGVMAPLLARDVRVRGIAVYGTILRNFFEYQVRNIRRQVPRAQARGTHSEASTRTEMAFWARILLDRLTPAEAAGRYPELASAATIGDSTHLFGRHVAFFHQLQDLDLYAAWARVAAPVLALHGEYDWISDPAGHADIAAIAAVHSPASRHVELPGLDHGMTWHASLGDSYRDYPRGTPSSAVARTLVAWMTGLPG